MTQQQAYSKVLIEEFSKESEPHLIKNFFLAGGEKAKMHLSFDEPIIFDGFVLGLCLQGNGRLKINFKEYRLAPGTILLLLPNQIINLEEKTDDLLIKNLLLAFDLILEFPSPVDFKILDYARRSPCVTVPEETIRHLMKYYSFISSEYEEIDNVYREEIVKTLLYALMLEISGICKVNEDSAETAPRSKNEELTDNFFRLLNKHYKRERSAAFYAGEMCMTPKYLSSAIKKMTGKSILQWIREAVVTEAKIMLRTSSQSILQISEELNFPNPSFFIQFFKQHTGMTPLKYRKTD